MTIEFNEDELKFMADKLKACGDPLHGINYVSEDIAYSKRRIAELDKSIKNQEKVLYELKVAHGMEVMLRDKL